MLKVHRIRPAAVHKGPQDGPGYPAQLQQVVVQVHFVGVLDWKFREHGRFPDVQLTGQQGVQQGRGFVLGDQLHRLRARRAQAQLRPHPQAVLVGGQGLAARIQGAVIDVQPSGGKGALVQGAAAEPALRHGHGGDGQPAPAVRLVHAAAFNRGIQTGPAQHGCPLPDGNRVIHFARGSGQRRRPQQECQNQSQQAGAYPFTSCRTQYGSSSPPHRAGRTPAGQNAGPSGLSAPA